MSAVRDESQGNRCRAPSGAAATAVLMLTAMGGLLHLAAPETASCDWLDWDNRRGVSSYRSGDYAGAGKNFEEAQRKNPDNPSHAYNLGNSRYMQNDFAGSASAYSGAVKQQADAQIKERALYNTGNALYRQGKLAEAESAYKEALKLDPKDADAKFNLEFVREKLKAQKQEQQNDPKKNDKSAGPGKSPNEARNENSSGANNAGQNKETDSRKQARPGESSAENGKDQSKQEEPKPAAPNRGQGDFRPDRADSAAQSRLAEATPDQQGKKGMTREEAEQWLRSLDENPKKFQRPKDMSEVVQGSAYAGKDW